MLKTYLTFAPQFPPVYIGGASRTPLPIGSNLVSRAILALTAIEHGNPTDQQLMQQIRQRKPEALSRIYDLYSTLVYSVAMRVLRDGAAAEDVMQEVFLKIWQKPDSFADQRGSLCAWLAVVTRNRAIDRIRAGKQFDNVDDLQLSNNVDLGAEAEREIMLQKVRAVLQTMPIDQRQAMEMAFFEGHTHTEIAQQTGQPLGTIKTRIRSALITIRKALELPA